MVKWEVVVLDDCDGPKHVLDVHGGLCCHDREKIRTEPSRFLLVKGLAVLCSDRFYLKQNQSLMIEISIRLKT